jgi:predicted nucleic acid-binding protein
VILVDSSSWIHFLRPDGDAVVRARVSQALREGEACWCDMVRLELWNGAGGERERSVLRDFERVLTSLPIDDAVWGAARTLAREARRRGITVPATDLLIAACARRHGANLESADADFKRLEGLTGSEKD